MDRRLRRALLAAVGLVLVGLALLAVWIRLHHPTPARMGRAVRQWAIARVLSASDSVYRLTLGHLRFNTQKGVIAIDSLGIETDSARNASRPRPLPLVSVVLRGGRVDGVDIQGLIRHRSSAIEIGGIRFERIEGRVRLPPARSVSTGSVGDRDPTAPHRAPAEPMRAGAESATQVARTLDLELFDLGPGTLPHGTPDLHVGRIELPSIGIAVGPARDPEGQVQSVGRLALSIGRVRVETRDSGRTLVYARDIRLRAEGYRGVWSRLASATLKTVEASVGDSVLRIEAVDVRPTMSDSELRRHLRWRRTRVRLRIEKVEAHGVDYATMLRHGGLVIRAIDLAQPRLDLLLDRALGPDPRPHPVPVPGEMLRSVGWRLTMDTIRARGGGISYGELDPRNSKPGVVTFERLAGAVTNVTNDPQRVSNPMRLRAFARVMGIGRLSTNFEISLATDALRMRYRGNLGPMPMTAFNRFAARNTRAKVRSGQASGLSFDASVVNDSALGRVILHYRDLKIGMTKRGDSGLGDAIKRHLGSFFVNNFKLRQDNPGDNGRPAVGRIARRRVPSDALFPFLWFTLRDALREAMTR